MISLSIGWPSRKKYTSLCPVSVIGNTMTLTFEKGESNV